MSAVFSDYINIDDSRIYAFPRKNNMIIEFSEDNDEVIIYENNYINKLLHFKLNYSEGIHFIYPEDYSIKINNSIKTSKKTSKKIMIKKMIILCWIIKVLK